MHSKIFQITTTKVDKECYLNEDTLMQGDNSYFDYICILNVSYTIDKRNKFDKQNAI